jgi:hypothetical protein
MKPNELRIGNWVNYCNGKRILDAELFLQLLKYTTPFDPIPLTEKWLLKFGFYETTKENYVSGLYTLNKPDGFYINKETMCYCEIDYEGTTNDRIKIQYVHQLQNLYFALTGEELTYGGGEQ